MSHLPLSLMLFSNFGCCISEGSPFRLFNSRDVLFCHGLPCKNPKWVKHFYKTPVKTFTRIHKRIFMSPQPNGRGTYCFWCGSRRRRCWRWRPRCSLPALYHLNEWVDFDQTCTDTLLGGRKEVTRFLWPWPYFQGHTSTLKFSSFDQKSLSAP